MADPRGHVGIPLKNIIIFKINKSMQEYFFFSQSCMVPREMAQELQ